MLSDGRQYEDGAALAADVCVIGTGAAGMTVALELAAAGVQVVVLEAGGRRAEREAQDTYRGHLASGTVHDRLDLVRQKRLGGTTAQWGGRCGMLEPLDLRRRNWVSDSGWPLEWRELEPHYRRAQALCDLGAFEYVAAEALGRDEPFIRDSEKAASRESPLEDDRLWRWSPPVDFWRRYGGRLAESHRAQVVHHANVVRLERDPEGGRVLQAVASPSPGREWSVKASVFVLASGGLETARLLLASNRETPAGIGNHHDLVGRFYMTHPVAEVGRVCFADAGRAAAGAFFLSRDGVWCRRMLKLDAGAQERHGLLNLAAALWFPDPLDPTHGNGLLSAFGLVRAAMARGRLDWKSAGVQRHYGQLHGLGAHLGNVARDLPAVGAYGAMWVRRRWLARRRLPSFMVQPADGPLRFRFDAEQSPERDNRVTLSRDRDRFGVPRLELRFRVSSSDRDSVVRSLRLIGDEFGRLGAGSVEASPEGDLLAELELGDGTHQMGVARMADNPRQGVVDRDCRVHDAQNLFLAGSAVFPTSGAMGPTLTIVALSVRIAEAVRAEVRPTSRTGGAR